MPLLRSLGNGTLSRYDIRIDSGAWIDTGLDLAHTFSSLEAETEHTVEVAAVNSAGRGAIASLSATTDAAPLTVPVEEINLTGTGIQIGSATQFGVSARFPRGLATDGTTVWFFDANKGYTLDPTTGIAIAVDASLTNFGTNESGVRSATYHDSQILVWGRSRNRIQIFNPTAGTLTDWHTAVLSYGGF